ncbi:MAG: hypothetical protein K2H85_00025, partial [Allobaculum sp.]|nr:hypothetical protein [Allobaculum sp.]
MLIFFAGKEEGKKKQMRLDIVIFSNFFTALPNNSIHELGEIFFPSIERKKIKVNLTFLLFFSLFN